MEKIKSYVPIILFSFLPISIIIGSGVSLLNTVLFSLCSIFIYFSKNKFKIQDFKPIIFLIILYLYLILNSFNSVDIASGIYRNFGFIRFILFFLMVNYLFLLTKKILTF